MFDPGAQPPARYCFIGWELILERQENLSTRRKTLKSGWDWFRLSPHTFTGVGGIKEDHNTNLTQCTAQGALGWLPFQILTLPNKTLVIKGEPVFSFGQATPQVICFSLNIMIFVCRPRQNIAHWTSQICWGICQVGEAAEWHPPWTHQSSCGSETGRETSWTRERQMEQSTSSSTERAWNETRKMSHESKGTGEGKKHVDGHNEARGIQSSETSTKGVYRYT